MTRRLSTNHSVVVRFQLFLRLSLLSETLRILRVAERRSSLIVVLLRWNITVEAWRATVTDTASLVVVCQTLLIARQLTWAFIWGALIKHLLGLWILSVNLLVTLLSSKMLFANAFHLSLHDLVLIEKFFIWNRTFSVFSDALLHLQLLIVLHRIQTFVWQNSLLCRKHGWFFLGRIVLAQSGFKRVEVLAHHMLLIDVACCLLTLLVVVLSVVLGQIAAHNVCLVHLFDLFRSNLV